MQEGRLAIIGGLGPNMVTWLVLLLVLFNIDIIIQNSAAIQSLIFGALILEIFVYLLKSVCTLNHLQLFFLCRTVWYMVNYHKTVRICEYFQCNNGRSRQFPATDAFARQEQGFLDSPL